MMDAGASESPASMRLVAGYGFRRPRIPCEMSAISKPMTRKITAPVIASVKVDAVNQIR